MKRIALLIFVVTVLIIDLFIFDLAIAAETKTKWGLNAIRAEEAQSLAGKKKVIVAIVDTGIDLKAFKNRLWVNPGEIPGNGIDDDNNGFIDDVHGFNIAGKSNDIGDQHGHGTHIAGIIQQVAPDAELMVLKYYEPGAHLSNILSTVKAIEYAVKMGAHIINYSGGGTFANPSERAALEVAAKKNILLVAAAGNDGASNDIKGFYPASYGLPNILSVASLSPFDGLLPSSNYGLKHVDIGAPGLDIESALPGGRSGVMTGTSQATAFVTGVAALLLSQNPQLPYSSVKERLTNFSRKVDALQPQLKSAASLDAYPILASRDSSVNAFDILDGAGRVNDPNYMFPPTENTTAQPLQIP